MHLLDYLIVCIPLIAVIIVAAKTQGYTRSVADFMSASRVAGRYLVCNSRGEAGFGAISAVASFEAFYAAGFAVGWWSSLSIPVGLLIGLSGFVVYRYRETRVMTMAQFFEVRYSKAFRVFAGLLAFLSGIVNYGIFPAVGSRFFVYYLGLPPTVVVGGFTIPTFAILMAVFLSTALFLTLGGGQLTIMVTDCIEGLVSGVFYLIVAFALLWMFRWREIAEALSSSPAGQSMINPFDSAGVKDFNVWYVLIGIFSGIYGVMAWQGGHAFNSSAASPHEAKMGGILGSWRGASLGVMLTLLGTCAFTYLNHPHFAAGATKVNEVLTTIDNPQLQTQMRVPVALGHFLPVGVKGAFCAIMIFALLSCDGSYLHSWGTIFIQDVILPFRKKPFTARQHIRLLRLSIVGVAIYAFLFSLLFQQTEYILMFFAITGAIFLGGAGSAIIGGFYWKKGTTAAAWSAMLVGSGLAVGGILLQQVPLAKQTLRIQTPTATAVTVNGEPAQRHGDVWEYSYGFQHRERWQSCRIIATQPDGGITNALFYAFGVPQKLPDALNQTGPRLVVWPPDRYVAPPPETVGGKLFVTIRSINGMWMYFFAELISVIVYVVVSLLTCREDFNLDRMLHRGKYAIETPTAVAPPVPAQTKWTLGTIIGFDENFSRGDKSISGSVFAWGMFWFCVFCVVTLWNLVKRWPTSWWASYWHVAAILVPLVCGVVTVTWFTWGGVRDLRQLFRSLKTVHRSELDDGMVVGHHNLDEVNGEANTAAPASDDGKLTR